MKNSKLIITLEASDSVALFAENDLELCCCVPQLINILCSIYLFSTQIDYDGKGTIKYGIGDPQDWKHFSRCLLTDLRKGVVYVKGKRGKGKSKINIQKVRDYIIYLAS